MTIEEFSSESVRDKITTRLYRKLPRWLNSYERNVIGKMSQNPSWEWGQGRQGGGYEKFNILSLASAGWIVHRALDEIGNPTQFDAFLLRYPVGSKIPQHDDPAEEGMCHVRFNAIVIAGAGGMLSLDGEELPLDNGDAYVFRPDVIQHSVTAVEECTRLVLSVGANIENEQAQVLGLT